MDQISHIRSLRRRSFGLLFMLAAVAMFAVACGSDDGGSSGGPDGVGAASSTGFQKIAQPDQVFTLEQLVAVGFKKSKTYNVEALEGATAAYYGFFGSDPYNRKEFEVRLYPSQQVALDSGVSFADESTGEDAVVLEDVQRWDVGLAERRQCAGNGGHHSGKCDNAKYGDYVVRGNMILMCQGKDSNSALDNCKELLDAITAF